jgi:hypothetical protein
MVAKMNDSKLAARARMLGCEVTIQNNKKYLLIDNNDEGVVFDTLAEVKVALDAIERLKRLEDRLLGPEGE